MRSDQPFAHWLKQQRKTLDLTQHDLARLVGCAVVTIQKIEEGQRRPSKQVAELLANHLGIAAEERTAFLGFARGNGRIAPTEAPVPNVEPETPTNLPEPLTPLIGRVREGAAILHALAQPDIRLVTLVGPPGVGKTRLSIHIAAQVSGHFADGVWFVDLSPFTDAALVLPAIASILAVTETGVMPLAERLRLALKEKQVLFILDNFEQVSDAATPVAALLQRCKGVKVLATSQTPLHLAGEHEYVLPPLSLPPPEVAPDLLLIPDQLLLYEALVLFVARVRQHQYDFTLTSANAAPITTICWRLDGLPLALELAAAALRRITLHQLSALLQEDAYWLHELHSSVRDLPPRQRTLYQAIAWSYRLLDTNLQTSFRQLGSFVGGFTDAAAQAVCGADPATLMHLTDHSLLVRLPGRWQMLEMIREFALAQMSSEERTATQQRHATYFVTQTVSQTASDLDALARDHANFRSALVWTISTQDAQAALTLCIKLCWFWETHGYLREGMTLARAALAMSNVVSNAAGDAVDPDLRIDALERVSTLAWLGHYFDIALPLAEEAATLARRNDRPGKLALTLNLLGRILIEQGDYAAAEVALQESTQLARQVAHLFNPGCPLTLLSEVALTRRDWETAQSYLVQAIPCLLRTPEGYYIGIHIAMAYTHLAEIALVDGNLNQARHALQQAFPKARLYIRRLRCLLVTLAGLLLHPLHTPTQEVTATELLGAVAGLGKRSGDPLSPLYQRLITQRSNQSQQVLAKRQWQTAWQVGYTWTQTQAIAAAERWLALDR